MKNRILINTIVLMFFAFSLTQSFAQQKSEKNRHAAAELGVLTNSIIAINFNGYGALLNRGWFAKIGIQGKRMGYNLGFDVYTKNYYQFIKGVDSGGQKNYYNYWAFPIQMEMKIKEEQTTRFNMFIGLSPTFMRRCLVAEDINVKNKPYYDFTKMYEVTSTLHAQLGVNMLLHPKKLPIIFKFGTWVQYEVTQDYEGAYEFKGNVSAPAYNFRSVLFMKAGVVYRIGRNYE